ncbi:hypothetical protein CC86DRAFT_189805 [Ophiobolus disseminans]|uniref:Uncharacterized protein n=1 Tax=Ophiobolus disseminans TaxID=1469910 RepID=A0A6A7A8F4_9PLEO|nr:hypothetical protein CC86DRAFT_189805 [Ophiobolus disseminans]
MSLNGPVLAFSVEAGHRCDPRRLGLNCSFNQELPQPIHLDIAGTNSTNSCYLSPVHSYSVAFFLVSLLVRLHFVQGWLAVPRGATRQRPSTAPLVQFSVYHSNHILPSRGCIFTARIKRYKTQDGPAYRACVRYVPRSSLRLTAMTSARPTSTMNGTDRNEQDDGLQFCKDGDWDGIRLGVGKILKVRVLRRSTGCR